MVQAVAVAHVEVLHNPAAVPAVQVAKVQTVDLQLQVLAQTAPVAVVVIAALVELVTQHKAVTVVQVIQKH